jgi:hypothetical protein
MNGADKVLLTCLWERTSAGGRQYLAGFLGKARLIAFRGAPLPNGTPTWDPYIAAGRKQADPAAASRREPTRPPATAHAPGGPGSDDGLPEGPR